MWKKIKSREIFKHPRLTLVEDTVELPDGTLTQYLKFKANNNSAMVICTRDNEVLLQKEYSYPPDEILYQFPGGKIESGETPEDGVIRELAEEAGLKPGSIERIGWFYVDNRRTNSKMFVFVAGDCTKSKKVSGDHEEEITSHWMPIDQIDRLIKDGKIVNYSVLAAWSLYKSI